MWGPKGLCWFIIETSSQNAVLNMTQRVGKWSKKKKGMVLWRFHILGKVVVGSIGLWPAHHLGLPYPSPWEPVLGIYYWQLLWVLCLLIVYFFFLFSFGNSPVLSLKPTSKHQCLLRMYCVCWAYPHPEKGAIGFLSRLTTLPGV